MARARQVPKSRDIDHLQDDLQNLREDVAQLSKQLEGALRDAGSDVADDVMKRLGRAKATVDQLIEGVGVKGADAARAAVELKDNLVDGVEESVREHPMMTLAVAMGVGFILSAALRR